MEGIDREFTALSQHIAEAIEAVLGVDVTIMDRARTRIAGTGRYKDQRFLPIGDKSAFVRCLETGAVAVVEDAGRSPLCLDCAEVGTCAERAEICVPIPGPGGPLGVIGVIAFDELQRGKLATGRESYLNFIEKMASLLEGKYAELLASEENKRLTARLGGILSAMNQALVVFGADGAVLYQNHKVEELLRAVGVGELDRFALWLRSFARESAQTPKREHVEAVYSEGERRFTFLCDVARLERGELLLSLTDYNHLGMRIVRGSEKNAGVEFEQILGVSPAMEAAKEMARAAAASASNLLLSGESGTGKEVFARAIHSGGARRGKPFVAINCGAIPDGLLESELFGYEKGAFTGATGTKFGKLEIADGGTLFLDEIGELPLHLQVKLLRALQEREVCRLGSNVTRKVDLRVIAATNADLPALMAAGRFREDLFYRLNIIPIRLPPLRARAGDVPHLTSAFLRQLSAQFGKTVRGLTQEAGALFAAYPWPGNVRELQNVLEFAVCMAQGEMIDAPLIRQRLAPAVPAGTPERIMAEPPSGTLKDRERTLLEDLTQRYAALGHKAMVERVCAELGISRATFYRRAKESQGETTVSE